MKVAILGTVGVPAKYGGFESLVENLLDYNESNIEYTIFCSSKAYHEKIKSYKGAKLKYLNIEANGFSSILYDGLSLLKCMNQGFDLILLLGVSGAIFLPFLKPFMKSKLICNIDGIEWKRNKWNSAIKKILKISELLAVKYSNEIITDNKGISEYVKFRYKLESTIIAYGAEQVCNSDNYLLKKHNLNKGKYFFKVCRVEPENNIELILKVFSELNDHYLVIVGNWNKSDFGKIMRNTYQKFTNIFLINPIYDLYELNQLRANCKGYIHGHSAGGTNPSLVEAMSLKVPIISFDVNFNRYTLNNNGVYFKSANDLKQIINEFDMIDFTTDIVNIYKTFNDFYTKENISRQYSNFFKHIIEPTT